MWEQIAWNFKNYNDKLVFEGLNEPRTRNSPAEWTGGTTPERNIINEYYQVFVDTVRASGGNNGKRILMINPYGANAGQAALSGLKIPNDSVQNKIIVSIHAYVPYNFALAGQNSGSAVDKWSKENNSDIQAIRAPLDLAHTIFVSKGIPVIMGEFGAVDRDNEEVRAEWAEYYVSYAKSKGIPCFWWDNNLYQRSGDAELFGIYDRGENFFPFPEIIDALMRASR
jgi:endoglucanase